MTAKQIARNGRITQEILKSRLHYNPETGIFTRIWCEIKKHKIGAEAGRLHPYGYRLIKVCDTEFMAHRLAWLYMTGEWPELCVDHVNGVRDDNRWMNLRVATDIENRRNRKVSVVNKSGCSGVTWEPNKKLWRASIMHGGKRCSLGRHKHIEDAIAARKAAERKYWGDFAPHA